MSLYHAYANTCTIIILCLKLQTFDYLPFDIIQLIIGCYFMIRSEPVVLILNNNNTVYDRLTNPMTHKLMTIHSRLRFNEVIFDCYPEVPNRYDDIGILSLFTRWRPMIILIPGPIWDTYAAKITYPKDYKQCVEGIQIMNGIWDDNIPCSEIHNIEQWFIHHFTYLTYINKYDVQNIDDIGMWILECFKNLEFLKAQGS